MSMTTEQALQKYADPLVQSVRAAAPEVWRAAVEKATGNAVGQIIFGVSWLVCLVGLGLLIRAMVRRYYASFPSCEEMEDRERWGMTLVPVLLGGALGLAIGVPNIVSGILTLCYRLPWNAITGIAGAAAKAVGRG
jgi:hypothetical protein